MQVPKLSEEVAQATHSDNGARNKGEPPALSEPPSSEQGIFAATSSKDHVTSNPTLVHSHPSSAPASRMNTLPLEGLSCASNAGDRSCRLCRVFFPTSHPNSSQCEITLPRPGRALDSTSAGYVSDINLLDRPRVFSRPISIPNQVPARREISNSIPIPNAVSCQTDEARKGQTEDETSENGLRNGEIEPEELQVFESLVPYEDDTDTDDSVPPFFIFSEFDDDDDDYFSSSEESDYGYDEYFADDEDSGALVSAPTDGSPGVLSLLSTVSSAETLVHSRASSPAESNIATDSGSEMEPSFSVAVNTRNVPPYLRRILSDRGTDSR